MNYRVILPCILIVLGAIAVSVWSAQEHKKMFTQALELKIVETRGSLSSFAVQTDRNEADEVVENIVVDCRDRQEFESLLSRLGSLNENELQRAKQLFGLCGDFFSLRKSFMVSRLEREHEVLNEYIALYDQFSEDNRYSKLKKTWDEIFELEKQKSELLAEQVAIQRSIINSLIQGKANDSKEIQSNISRAREIAELLSVADTRVDDLRKQETKRWTQKEY